MLLDPLGEVVALGVDLEQIHLRRDRPQRRDQLLADQLLDRLGVDAAVAQRPGGAQDVLAIGLHADVELGQHVGAQVVAGDEGVLPVRVHAELHGLEVDLQRPVEERQDRGATVEDHVTAAQAGADEGLVGAGAPVERQERDDDPAQGGQAADHARITAAAAGRWAPSRLASRLVSIMAIPRTTMIKPMRCLLLGGGPAWSGGESSIYRGASRFANQATGGLVSSTMNLPALSMSTISAWRPLAIGNRPAATLQVSSCRVPWWS